MQQQSLIEYGSRRVIITITAIICALLEIVDTTIVNVALNDMKGNLGATTNEIGWVVTAYAIGNVIIIPMTSWLSQQFGRRNYFAASIVLFTIFSFLCGNSTSIEELIIFRFLQGVGGGALLVTSQTIITESYPVEKRRHGPGHLWFRSDHWANAWTTTGRIYHRSFSMALYFLHQYSAWSYCSFIDTAVCKKSEVH